MSEGAEGGAGGGAGATPPTPPPPPPPSRPSRAAGTFIESEQGEIRFPEITTPVLEKVCQYFYYRLKYANT